jgi:hypothetical protein
MQKRLLAFALVLACAGATVVGRTTTMPAIDLAPADAGVLVSVVTTALWSAGWSATQAPMPGFPCVILKRAPAGTHPERGSEFSYVQGTFPPGVPFHMNLADRQIREIVKKGGKFVVLEPDYAAADLEGAQRVCQG